MKESVIKMVLDNNWADLNKYVESTAAKKIKSKIDQKKTDIIEAINEGSELGESASPKQIDKLEALLKSKGYISGDVTLAGDKSVVSYKKKDGSGKEIIVRPDNVDEIINQLEEE